jgi:hypothetical protein
MAGAIMRRVVKGAGPDACWRWTGHVKPEGYGQVTLGGKKKLVHRVSYELNVGEIPIGLSVLHRCDIRSCVRPDHLFLGTHADNMADMDAKGRCDRFFKPGHEHPFAKLTASDVEEIRRRWTSGETQTSIAKDFSVCSMTINGVCSGRSYKNA